MSEAMVVAAGSLFAGPVRLFAAPVDRANAAPVPFDPASMGRFALDAPPAGWLDAGTVLDFERLPAQALIPVLSGAPAAVKSQVRRSLEEAVGWTFSAWTRAAMALSSGAQTMNLLRTVSGGGLNPSGGPAAAAIPLLAGSTATALHVTGTAPVAVGDLVVVDADYAGATGYVGTGAAGAYVASPPEFPDEHFTRRVSFNVARVSDVSGGVVTLASPLPAGVPDASMKVSVVDGFVDRAAGGFVPEWSALFVVEGVQGDRMILHYPRLQPTGDTAAEVRSDVAKGVDRWRPRAKFRALPVIDANGNEAAVCFRSYLPAPLRMA